jgi:hypothetical protein
MARRLGEKATPLTPDPAHRIAQGKPVAGKTAALTPTAVGWVSLQPEDIADLAVLCELGDVAPDVTGGYGGWTVVDRQRDTAITSWQGFQPITVDLALWIDGFPTGMVIDRLIDNLDALAGRGRKRLPGQPPTLIVDTAGVMRYDYTSIPELRWVITDLNWDSEEAVVDDAGHRVRAACTVTIMQFVDAASLRNRALETRLAAQRKTQAARKTHIAKDGETLITIARKELGDPGRWPELAKLNGIRDPLAVKRGAHIFLPS